MPVVAHGTASKPSSSCAADTGNRMVDDHVQPLLRLLSSEDWDVVRVGDNEKRDVPRSQYAIGRTRS